MKYEQDKKESTEQHCPKCGSTKRTNDIECLNCGIIYDKYEKIQSSKAKEKGHQAIKAQIEQDKIKTDKHKKETSRLERENMDRLIRKRIWNSFRNSFSPSLKQFISVFLIISISIVSIYLYKEKEYIANLNLANQKMISSLIKCLEMCELYSKVWREAIEDRDNRDFNDALSAQRAKFEFFDDIKDINQSKELIKSILQELNSPIDFYPEAHKKIVQLFGVYSQIHSLAESPSGSLTSYNMQINDLQNEYLKIINEISVSMPNKKE